MFDASSLIRPRKVTADGEGLVSRAGLVVLDRMAEVTGLTEGFRTVFESWPRRRLDPGDGYAQVVIGLADRASCLSDVTGVARSGLSATQRRTRPGGSGSTGSARLSWPESARPGLGHGPWRGPTVLGRPAPR